MITREKALGASSPGLTALGLHLVDALTTAALNTLEALDRHPIHLPDRGVRLLDRLRNAARM